MSRVTQGITIYILSEADADENLTSTIEVTGSSVQVVAMLSKHDGRVSRFLSLLKAEL